MRILDETVERYIHGLRPERSPVMAEMEAVAMYREGARYCESVNDFVSRDLFTDVLSTEEHHVDMLETQFEMIGRMGIHNYVQLHSEAAPDES